MDGYHLGYYPPYGNNCNDPANGWCSWIKSLGRSASFSFILVLLGFPCGSWSTMISIVPQQWELNKGNRDSILNLSKSKRQIIKLLSVDDSIFIFLSYGTLVVHIGWVRDGCSAIIFVKHVKTLHPSFVIVHKSVQMHCRFVVKAPANVIMQHKQRQLGQNQLWHVLQNWLLCSHPWPNMNEQWTTLK